MPDAQELEAKLAELEATIALEAEDPDARAELLTALVSRADTLADLHRFEEADVAYAKLIEAFGEEDEDPVILRTLARGLFNRAIVRRDSGSLDGALAAVEDFLIRCDQDPPPGRLDMVVRGRALQASLLWRLGRQPEAILVYDATLERYAEEDDVRVRARLAAMILAEGRLAKRAGELDLALGAFNTLLETFGEAEQPSILKTLTDASFQKGVVLGELGRDGEALVVWRAIWERYADDPNPPWETLPLAAHYNEAVLLKKLGRGAEAAEVCDEMIDRSSEADSERVAEVVAGAIQLRLTLIGQGLDPNQNLAQCDHLLERILSTSSESIRDQRYFATYVRLWQLLGAARWREAITASEDLLGQFESETDPDRLYERGAWLLSAAQALVLHRRIRRARTRLPTMIAVRLGDWAGNLPAGRLAATIEMLRRTRDQALRIQRAVERRLSGEQDLRLGELVAKAQMQTSHAWMMSLHPVEAVTTVSRFVESGPPAVAAIERQLSGVDERDQSSLQAAFSALTQALILDQDDHDGDPYAELISAYGSVRSLRVQLIVLAARLCRRF